MDVKKHIALGMRFKELQAELNDLLNLRYKTKKDRDTSHEAHAIRHLKKLIDKLDDIVHKDYQNLNADGISNIYYGGYIPAIEIMNRLGLKKS